MDGGQTREPEWIDETAGLSSIWEALLSTVGTQRGIRETTMEVAEDHSVLVLGWLRKPGHIRTQPHGLWKLRVTD